MNEEIDGMSHTENNIDDKENIIVIWDDYTIENYIEENSVNLTIESTIETEENEEYSMDSEAQIETIDQLHTGTREDEFPPVVFDEE